MTANPMRTTRVLVIVLAAGCAGASGAQGMRGPFTPLRVAADLLRPAPEGPRAGAAGLDVNSLKERLRDTDAIGVFTKLALKNQMDDLLQLFRSHHAGGRDTDIAPLRQPYELLVLKVLSLVQDGDPSLAHTISGSRDAIWNILADPLKFRALV